MEINADEDMEPEDPNKPLPPRRGMGSVTMIMLLFKATLQLRDSNNKLTYHLEKMHRDNLTLHQKLKELESKLSIGSAPNEKEE